jgi:aspartyl-tRNA(Asn)/glutamyl-tRNA(Gln) amidotransferase subunit B
MFGTKVEIKNLNSIANVEKAIAYEMLRQEQIYVSGGTVNQETRRFDETTKQTISMRAKTDAVDYKYFPEPNLVPIQLSETFILEAIEHRPELASEKFHRYSESFELSAYDASLLTKDVEIASYFDALASLGNHYKLYANWLLKEVMTWLNKKGLPIHQFPISAERLIGLIEMIATNTISNKQAKELFDLMLHHPISAAELAKKHHMLQISDPSIIQQAIDDILAEFPQSILDYKEGKDRAVGFLIGQIMKKTGGKLNPGLTSQLLIETLKK